MRLIIGGKSKPGIDLQLADTYAAVGEAAAGDLVLEVMPLIAIYRLIIAIVTD